VNFQENDHNRSQDKTEKVVCSTSNFPLINQRSQADFPHTSCLRAKFDLSGYSLKSTFFPLNYPYLLTDCNRTYTICNTCAGSSRY